MKPSIICMLAALCLSACSGSKSMSYDFGRAYSGAFRVQPKLDRKSVSIVRINLSGLEGTEIRVQAALSTGDQADVTKSTTGNGAAR